MNKTEPDYVTGRKGRYQLQPPIIHPAFCVCRLCAKRRTADNWAREVVIRARRTSPAPENRQESAVAAANLKTQLERELREAVIATERAKNALAGRVTWKQLCDAYRAHHERDGKRLDRDKYLIDALEAHFGSDRDPESISKQDYATYVEALRARKCKDTTILRYTNTLLAILNSALRDDIIAAHRLVGVRKPQGSKPAKPVTFTRRQVAVLLGPAMDAYEHEQAAAHAAYFAATRYGAHARGSAPTRTPLRGLTLIAYLTLMRPANNFALTWEQIRLHPRREEGTFHLDEHKNARKGIVVDGHLHPMLVRYLRSIYPGPNATGLVHPNPETGKAYVNIRPQWKRLVSLANALLDPRERLKKKTKATHFYTWRHTGASSLAESSRDPVMVARLMGDTQLTTVYNHYFDTSTEHQAREIARWAPFNESDRERDEKALIEPLPS